MPALPEPPPRRGATGVRAVRRPVPGLVGPVLTIGLTVLVALVGLAQVWDRLLWFDSVGARRVFTRQTTVQAGMFLGAALPAAALVASGLVVGYRARPVLVPMDLADLELERRRAALEPLRRIALVLAPLVVGVVAGLVAASRWATFLLWWHRRPFGVVDPGSGRDVSFFVMELPWWSFVVDTLLVLVAVAAATAVVTHLAYGGLRVGPGARSTAAAVVHLSSLLAALLALQAARYVLDAWEVAVTGAAGPAAAVSGATYTVDHVVVPGRVVLAVAAAVAALLCLAPLRTGTWRWPVAAVGALAVCAVVLGSLAPALVEWLRVAPQRAALEAPYAASSLRATRAAFGLDAVERVPAPTTARTTSTARDAAAVASGVPVVDPVLAQPAADAAAARLPGGTATDLQPVVADDGRPELRAAGAVDPSRAGRSWDRRHLEATHGYGVLRVDPTRVGADGRPVVQRTVPGQPRTYFYPGADGYVVVGGPGGPRELDGPDGASRSRYDGTGGVPLRDAARRAAVAVAQRDPELLLSGAVSSASRVLDVRDPVDRVRAVAPWLVADSHPYPVVVGGRIVWVVDGYTTSTSYPGSPAIDMAAATGAPRGLGDGPATATRYLRDAVKATVDAYDGTVTLYAWDATDPLLGAWRSAFPGLVRPVADMPAALVRGLRYPWDLFCVQRSVLAQVHDDDPAALLSASPWRLSPQVSSSSSVSSDARPTVLPPAPPVLVRTGALGDAGRPALVSTLVSADGGTTRAVLVADTSAPHPGGAGARPRLRLVLAPDRSPAPEAVASAVRTGEATSSTSPGRLRDVAAAARSVAGEVVVVPAPGGPLAVQAVWGAVGSGAPTLRAVAVAHDGRLAWGATLPDATADLAAGRGASLPTSGAPAPTTSAPAPTPSRTSSAALPPAERSAAADAAAALDAATEAARRGDGRAYREARARLDEAERRLDALVRTATPTAGPPPSG